MKTHFLVLICWDTETLTGHVYWPAQCVVMDDCTSDKKISDTKVLVKLCQTAGDVKSEIPFGLCVCCWVFFAFICKAPLIHSNNDCQILVLNADMTK